MATSHKARRLAEATVKAWRKMFGKQQQEISGRIVRVKSEGVPLGQLRHVKQLVTPATHVPANKRPRGKAYRKTLDREVAAGWYTPQPRHEESL